MINQLNLPFENKSEPVPEKEENSFDTDKLMVFLKKMNYDAERQNQELQAMLDEIQKGWTEDEKLQVRDPKEYQRQQKLKETGPKETIMPELTIEAIETLKNSKVKGTTVILPEGQLDRKIYLEVKNRLELIGGKWKGGKVGGFIFQEDPSELLQQIASGEKRNMKKEFQFFGTPDKLADKLVELAEINESDNFLEPSAGQGSIIKAIQRTIPSAYVQYCELMTINKTILQKIPNTECLCDDFLDKSMDIQAESYSKIIANPPFSKNQDIDHIRQMYKCLSEGGRLVSVASKHWQLSSNKKEVEFKNWLESVNAEIMEIPAGEFKESGTTIATCIIVIDKK